MMVTHALEYFNMGYDVSQLKAPSCPGTMILDSASGTVSSRLQLQQLGHISSVADIDFEDTSCTDYLTQLRISEKAIQAILGDDSRIRVMTQ